MVRRDINFGSFIQRVPAFEATLNATLDSPLDLFLSHLRDTDRLNEEIADIGYDNLFYDGSLDLLMNRYTLRELVLKPYREILLEGDDSM